MVIKRLEAFWNDEITYIPVIIRVNPKLNVSYKEYLLSNEAQLKHQLHSVSPSLRVGSDYVPNLWPYMATSGHIYALLQYSTMPFSNRLSITYLTTVNVIGFVSRPAHLATFLQVNVMHEPLVLAIISSIVL